MIAMYWFMIAIAAVSFAILLNFLLLTVWASRTRETPALSRYPMVSILKPVKNADKQLAANLDSFYHLDYGSYEILYGVDSNRDGSIPVIQKLAERYPHIPSRIVITGTKKRGNPKIDTLQHLLGRAAGELLWVTDANVRVGAHLLQQLVGEHQQHGAHLVFSPILATGSRSLSSLMENSYINLFVSGAIVGSWIYLRKPIVVGKSMLIERGALESLGEFAYFQPYLAEDYIMGQTFKHKGYTVSTNCAWITNVNTHTTLRQFFQRISRWAKMRARLNLSAYLTELLANPLALVPLLAALSGRLTLSLALLVFVCKLLVEYISFLCVNRLDRHSLRAHLLFPAAILLKDILLFVIFSVSLLSSTVEWHGRKIHISRDTRIQDE